MLYPTLHAISEHLNFYIYEKWGDSINGSGEIVQLNNISNISDSKNDLQNKIIFTLIKVEEESSLKNGAYYTKKETKEVIKHHPAIYLNLYLLVSITKKTYKESLQLLSDTISFFQSNKVFAGKFSSESSNEEREFRVTVEQYDTSFQEVFDMWSNLGNKHFPSVIYKIRLLRFFDEKESKPSNVIKSISVQYD